MKHVADESVDKPIVDRLRNAGFDILYILETNQGKDDKFIWNLAVEPTKNSIWLTYVKDYW